MNQNAILQASDAGVIENAAVCSGMNDGNLDVKDWQFRKNGNSEKMTIQKGWQ